MVRMVVIQLSERNMGTVGRSRQAHNACGGRVRRYQSSSHSTLNVDLVQPKGFVNVLPVSHQQKTAIGSPIQTASAMVRPDRIGWRNFALGAPKNRDDVKAAPRTGVS